MIPHHMAVAIDHAPVPREPSTTMDENRIVRISKFLSLHLRHRPERLGLRLADGGWVDVHALLTGCAERGFPLTRDELAEAVARNDKQRFSFDPSGTRIRANQGHSVTVDLQFEPASPPAVLYHGTGQGAVGAILKQGLRKMRRHPVHLSADAATARRVGARHGHPVVFAVDVPAMAAAVLTFYRSANGVWLVDHVPPEYLRKTESA